MINSFIVSTNIKNINISCLRSIKLKFDSLRYPDTYSDSFSFQKSFIENVALRLRGNVVKIFFQPINFKSFTSNTCLITYTKCIISSGCIGIVLFQSNSVVLNVSQSFPSPSTITTIIIEFLISFRCPNCRALCDLLFRKIKSYSIISSKHYFN